jgi:hypothetical protein
MIKPCVNGTVTVCLFNKRKPFVTSEGDKKNAMVVWNVLLYRHAIKIERAADYCKNTLQILRRVHASAQGSEVRHRLAKFIERTLGKEEKELQIIARITLQICA